MNRHEDLVLAALKCRHKIVRDVILPGCTLTEAERQYYEGKAEGYSQAIALLNESAESVAVELETPEQ